MDPCSFANAIPANLIWDIKVDFDSKLINGKATWILTEPTTTVTLDTSELTIKSTNGKHQFLEKHSALGTPLKIDFEQPTDKIEIEYSTTDKCSAAKFLDKNQTLSRTNYLFTQCQAIHARSLLPCFDAPKLKFKYTATVSLTEKNLQGEFLVPLMSALKIKTEKTETTQVTSFEQPIPISSYLLALAVGNLVSAQIGPRSYVYSEPELIEKCAYEFGETEKFIKAAEDILTPYVWGLYDILVLPFSFPFGGMENPNLTFVTPSLIAGDRSLTDVVAHEISHSWTGNLVTNHSWESFFLNEGWTVWLGRAIVRKLHSEEHRQFASLQGDYDLRESINRYKEGNQMEYTKLCPNLQGIDPDDAFSSVPYEKGYQLLYHVESILGYDVFEKYAKDYINNFKYKSLSAADWKDFLNIWTSEKAPLKLQEIKDIDYDAWFNHVGLPPKDPGFDKTLYNQVITLADEWLHSKELSGFDKLTVHQKIYLIDVLMTKELVDEAFVVLLDKKYEYLDKPPGNLELQFRFIKLSLQHKYDSALPLAKAFLENQGRMKYVRPLYRTLNKSYPEVAKETFEKNKTRYHPICAKLVGQDLGLQ